MRPAAPQAGFGLDAAVVPGLLLLIARDLAWHDAPRVLGWRLLHDATFRGLPLGLSALLLGAYTVTVRRQAVPQILGVLTAENGVFFAGLAIAGSLPIIVEIAAALDVVIVAVVLGLLTRRIHEQTGTTVVANLRALKEG